jgi:hypothetical protein
MPATNSDAYHPVDRTNNSAYAVLAKGIPFVGRAYVGIGRGRFVARAGKAEDLHGIFAGGEIDFMMLRLVGEVDGRFVNAGIGVEIPGMPCGPVGIGLNALVGGKYLQNVRPDSQDAGMREAVFGRLELVITWKKAEPMPAPAAPPAPAAAAKPAAAKPSLLAQARAASSTVLASAVGKARLAVAKAQSTTPVAQAMNALKNAQKALKPATATPVTPVKPATAAPAAKPAAKPATTNPAAPAKTGTAGK